jgi:transposase
LRSAAQHVRIERRFFFPQCQLKCQTGGTRVSDNVLVRWMHRVRLYPSSRQEARLHFALDITRQIYNAALAQRRDVWVARRQAINPKSQYAEITALRAEDGRIAACYRECEDAALHRLDLAFAAFFRRIKAGEVAGYPRFRSAARWKQLEFPHGDRALRLTECQNQVRIPMVGSVRLRKGRVIPPYGRAFLVERTGRWYAVFECQRDLAPLAPSGRAVGIDRGIRALVATSEGELFENPRHAERRRKVVTSGSWMTSRSRTLLGECETGATRPGKLRHAAWHGRRSARPMRGAMRSTKSLVNSSTAMT